MSRMSSTFGKPPSSNSVSKSFAGKTESKSCQLASKSPSIMKWQDSLRSTTGSKHRVSAASFITGCASRSRRFSIPFFDSSRDLAYERRHSLDHSPLQANDSMFTSTLKRSGSTGNLRKSNNSLAANFNKSSSKASNPDLERIEAEYIKNLQQQVYFLELEANYLREQAKKASEMQPVMSAEAEKMLTKLRRMQAEVDGQRLENKRQESTLEIAKSEKDRLFTKIKTDEDNHQREKRLLLEEIVQTNKEKEILARDVSRKDLQILQGREDLDKSATALRTSETKIQMCRNQLEQKSDQIAMVQSQLEEKRGELVKIESMLRDVEEKYYSSSARVQDSVVQDLRDEIRLLHEKLKESELSCDQDRYLRGKWVEDSARLVKENAALNQQVVELQRQLERERGLRESTDSRRSQGITELVVLRESEKSLKYELSKTRDQLLREQEHGQRLIEKVTSELASDASVLGDTERMNTSLELSSHTHMSRLAEVAGASSSLDTENSQLRRDKMLLIDHVADLQKKLDDKGKDGHSMHTEIRRLQVRNTELEHLKDLEQTLHSQKWEEFSRLADSMKTLSKNMATGRSDSPLAL